MNNEKAINVIVVIMIVGTIVFGLDTCFPSYAVQPSGTGGYDGGIVTESFDGGDASLTDEEFEDDAGLCSM